MLYSLIHTLEHYSAYDATEAAHQIAILELLRTQPNPFNRHCYDPGHITGSTWIWAEDTQQVGLIYHRRLDRWLQPGGHAEPGETDGRTTALREAKEEIGLALDPSKVSLLDLDIHRIPARDDQPSHYHFDIRYLGLTQKQPLVSASDAAQAVWFSASELKTMGMDDSMQRMFDKCLKHGFK